MKYIKLSSENVVIEILPEFDSTFPNIPITKRYTQDFLSELIKVDENTNVENGWVYDATANTFSEYTEPVDKITELENQVRILEGENKALKESNAFYEECLVEMAEIIYA